jgi:hypothetical protein
MNLTETIKKSIREEISKSEKLKELMTSQGIDFAAKLVGGINNLINVVYGGDFEKYVKDNNIEVVKFSDDGLNMYFHPVLAHLLGANNKKFLGADYLELGKFRYGPGLPYLITADLQPIKQNGEVVRYRVVGISGDFGFGYSFITKRNTLGKRFRQQVFKQIIDKYELRKYLS